MEIRTMCNNQDVGVLRFYTVVTQSFVFCSLSPCRWCLLLVVPQLILGGPISWFFSTLWNDHWVLPFVSHPLNSFPSIKELFLQPASASLVVFCEEPSKSLSGEPNLWCPLDPLYQLSSFLDSLALWPFSVLQTQLSCWVWKLDLLVCASQKSCLTLFYRQVTLITHHSCSNRGSYPWHIWHVPAAALQFHSFFSTAR